VGPEGLLLKDAVVSASHGIILNFLYNGLCLVLSCIKEQYYLNLLDEHRCPSDFDKLKA
jgi:hypothetical protein